MSRHKNIRNLDLDEGLYGDGYGSGYDDGQGEIRETDREKLNEGLRKTREVLGNDIAGLTDRDIREPLWYYFFDVEKTINYILNQHGKPSKKKKPQAKKGCSVLISGTGQGQGFFRNYEVPRSAVEHGFFMDAPWGRIPEGRRGPIIVEPLCPHGGLLGGSGGPSSGKTSKLAALAKARKEKAEAQKKQQQEVSDGEKSTAVSMLSRLSVKQSPPPTTPVPLAVTAALDILPTEWPESPIARILASAPDHTRNKPSRSLDQPTREGPEEQPVSDKKRECFVPALDLRAGPSKFALSMFGDRLTSAYEIEVTDSRMFSLPGASMSAFAGPSLDDVVVAAQSSSKELNSKAAPKNGPKAVADAKAMQKVEAALQAINIDDTPVKQRKNLNVLEE